MPHRTRVKVTYEAVSELRVVCLAQLGLSSRVIERETGLSSGQISYRLRKAQAGEGYEPRQTYRSDWRNGTSDVVRTVRQHLEGSLMSDTKARLVPLFEHPTPEVAPKKRR